MPVEVAVLDRLQAEHRNGPENLRDLRVKLASTAAGGENNAAFTAALRNYTQGMKSHVRSEEKDAMPLAREVLTADDWAEIDRAFLDNEDPLFGGKAKAEFRELFHRIVSLASGRAVPVNCNRACWPVAATCCCRCPAWKAAMAGSRR